MIAPPLTGADRCGYCERPSEELVTYADGLSICLACRRKEQERFAAANQGLCNRCPYHMAWHRDGECPSEAEARERSGAQ